MRGIVVGGFAKLSASMLSDPELIAYAQAAVLFVASAPHEVHVPYRYLPLLAVTCRYMVSGSPAIAEDLISTASFGSDLLAHILATAEQLLQGKAFPTLKSRPSDR